MLIGDIAKVFQGVQEDLRSDIVNDMSTMLGASSVQFQMDHLHDFTTQGEPDTALLLQLAANGFRTGYEFAAPAPNQAAYDGLIAQAQSFGGLYAQTYESASVGA